MSDIFRPAQSIEAQVKFQDETVHNALRHLTGTINESLSKYPPNDDGIYSISIPMQNHRDAAHFWYLVEEKLVSAIEASGWSLIDESQKVQAPWDDKNGDFENPFFDEKKFAVSIWLKIADQELSTLYSEQQVENLDQYKEKCFDKYKHIQKMKNKM